MSIKFNGATLSPSIENLQPTDFSKVTARPEFVLRGKKFYDEAGQLRVGEMLFSGSVDSESGATIAELTAENTELKTQNATLTTQNDELTTENTELKEENESLAERTSELTMKNVELSASLADAEADATYWKDAYEEADDQIRALTAENEELQARIEELEGGSSGGSDTTDQTALAGAYTDATFTTRAYTWDELLERGDSTKNGGIYPYQNPPSAELAGYYYVYGENYAFVIPDTITTGAGTEGCKALVFPATTTTLTSMEGTIDTIYIKATTPPTLPYEDFFCDCNYNSNNGVQYAVNIVVPVGCGNAYKTATNWSNYADYITEGAMPI